MKFIAKNKCHISAMAGLIGLAVLLTGCIDSILPPAFTSEPTIIFNPNPAAPMGAMVKFSANKPVSTAIRIKDGEWERELLFDHTYNPEEGLPIVGMVPDKTHELRVFIHDDFGRLAESAKPLAFHSLSLPEDRASFPPIEWTAKKADQMEPGILLFSPHRRRANDLAFDQHFGLLVALNGKGKVVWYYRTDTPISDFQRLRNGNIVYITQDFRVVEIDWLGNVQSTWYATGRPQGPASGIPIETMAIHHEIDELPNGNLVVLGAEKRTIENDHKSDPDQKAPRETQELIGDQIIEFQRDGKIVWQWNAFDNLDPMRIGFETFDGYWSRRGFPDTVDRTHGNGLLYDEENDAYLISLRFMDAILSINRSSKEIDWILGEPSGWAENLQGKLLKLDTDTRWFYHQHGPVHTPQGSILVYDNGNYGTRPFNKPHTDASQYSRAVEYEIDASEGTAKEVWVSEVAGDSAVFSVAMGDIDWLPEKGNVLVSNVMLAPRHQGTVYWTRVREYSHAQPAEVLSELVLRDSSAVDPVGWTIFGVQHLPYMTPCNFCYSYPGPRKPSKRPF